MNLEKHRDGEENTQSPEEPLFPSNVLSPSAHAASTTAYAGTAPAVSSGSPSRGTPTLVRQTSRQRTLGGSSSSHSSAAAAPLPAISGSISKRVPVPIGASSYRALHGGRSSYGRQEGVSRQIYAINSAAASLEASTSATFQDLAASSIGGGGGDSAVQDTILVGGSSGMSTNAWISPESSPSEGGEAAEGYHRSYVVAPGYITRLRRSVPYHDALTAGLYHNPDLDLETDLPDTTATPPMAAVHSAVHSLNRMCDEEQSPSGRRSDDGSAAPEGGSRRRSSSVIKGIVRGYEERGDAAERLSAMWRENRCADCFSANCADPDSVVGANRH